MKTTIFKEEIPLNILLDLLEKVCNKNYEYYLIDKNVFQLIIYRKYQESFLEKILPYYHKSKQRFVTRDFNYNSFVNIVRQICNSNDHEFIANKIYNHSEYTIRYIVKK